MNHVASRSSVLIVYQVHENGFSVVDFLGYLLGLAMTIMPGLHERVKNNKSQKSSFLPVKFTF